MRNPLRNALMLLVLGALAASLALNSLLYRHARSTYAELQSVRLDPAGTGRFSEANAALGPPAPERSRIVVFGDSRAAQWRPTPELPNMEWVNRGIDGETTAQALLRLDGDVLALQPSVVVLELGINDLKTLGVLPGRREKTVAGCAANLTAMARRLESAGVGVVVVTVLPPGSIELARRPVWSDDTRAAVREVNETLRALEGPGVAVVDGDPLVGPGGRLDATCAADALHLNATGYGRLNPAVSAAVTRVLMERKGTTTVDAVQ